MSLYRSPYEAYPFLCDAGEDLRCDFELLTDDGQPHRPATGPGEG